MANPEDEEHLFERPDQQPVVWNVEQSTGPSNDVIDAARTNLRSNNPIICKQSNKDQMCDCECFSNSIPLSSSIVHIDENESDDEYLDAVNYITANCTPDDLGESNILNSKNSFNMAISSNLFLKLNNQQPTQTKSSQQTDNHPHQTIDASFCKSSSSSITNPTHHHPQSNNNNHKCHCRPNTPSTFKPSRPLSLSSISSSSSSCCSLSRNNSLALSDHLKKPYLASIESLGDDELNGCNVNKCNHPMNSDEHSSSGISSACHSENSASSTEPSVHSTCSCCVLRSNSNLSLVRSASTTSNQSQCRCNHLDNYEPDYSNKDDLPNIYHHSTYQTNQNNVNTLSQMDRVIMEIVQTESAYVKDLNEIIEGYFVYLNKRLLESEHLHQMKKASDDYESDGEDETSRKTFEVSSPILKGTVNKQTKRNTKQRGKSKLAFGNLTNNNGNQFNLDESSVHNQIQTSHTLPKSSKQLQNSMKLKSQQEQLQSIVSQQMNQAQECNISQEQLISLFGNLNDIYQFNSLFLNQLMQCEFEAVPIAKCFVNNANGFHVYSQYCTNYPKQVETLSELNRNPYTNQLLKKRQIELGHSLPLFSYLLKPVQRILKYHLLLNNMVKHFELEHPITSDTTDSSQKESEDAERSLRNALNVMTNIASHINTMKKKHEYAVRVQEIQSLLLGWQGEDLTTFGELVAESTFKVFGNKSTRHLFLFEKMLLVVKKKDDSLFTYKDHILCSNLMLIESIRSEPLCFNTIWYNNPKIQYTFQAKNLDQKREWCVMLKKMILESYHSAIPNHAKQIVLGLGQKTSGLINENKHRVFPMHLNRKLSAPEYLEKRCKTQQNKTLSTNTVTNCNQSTNLSLGLQFSSLQKGFKLRKSLKKGVHLIGGRNASSNLNNNSEINEPMSIDLNKEINKVENVSTDHSLHLANDHNNDHLEMKFEQPLNNELISSYEEANHHTMESNYVDKLVNNDIPSCLSSTSLTTTNDSYTDSGVGSTNSVCCYSQLRLTTPISLGSSIASIESNATTTTANSYSTGYSRLSGSTNLSNKLTDLQCTSISHRSAGNQSSTDDFNELMINDQLGDHELNIKTQNGIGIKQATFKNKRCTNRCCHGELANRYVNRIFDSSASTSLTKFDSNNKANYLQHHSKFYRHSKYMHLTPEEIDYRPHNAQVRRVQSFTIGNKNLNSRLLTNYSSTYKSFALNSGCSSSNGSAPLQHTVSFRKSPNVDLALAKLRHLHRRPGIVAAQKQMYKQQKMQQLNELKLQELNLNNMVESKKIDSSTKSSNDESNVTENQIEQTFNDKDNCTMSEDEKKRNLIESFIKPNKLSKNKDSTSMEELSPTTPAIWVKKHEKHYFKDAHNFKKGGSLPRNFEALL